MTGLDIDKDVIIEIAVIITDGHLRPVDDGINFVINTPKDVLDEYVSLVDLLRQNGRVVYQPTWI